MQKLAIKLAKLSYFKYTIINIYFGSVMSIDSSTNINKIFTYQNKHMLIYVETQLISYKDDFINKSNLSVTWIPISSTVVSRNLNYHIDLIQYELYNDEFLFIVKQD